MARCKIEPPHSLAPYTLRGGASWPNPTSRALAVATSAIAGPLIRNALDAPRTPSPAATTHSAAGTSLLDAPHAIARLPPAPTTHSGCLRARRPARARRSPPARTHPRSSACAPPAPPPCLTPRPLKESPLRAPVRHLLAPPPVFAPATLFLRGVGIQHARRAGKMEVDETGMEADGAGREEG
ncbi:hypothetical protein B0H14DRAFT_3869432 [Mycena olivaceomarginata]|nr:hypothetical protein B0H14DRAFT_3869432 [Mycena olivaceomarginata]